MVIFAFIVTGCNKDEQAPTKDAYIVTFNSNGGSEIAEVEVKAGVSVTKEFKESPKLKPVSIVVEKKNQDGTPLRDAYFEVKYYDLYINFSCSHTTNSCNCYNY